jgi:hypothetical protein
MSTTTTTDDADAELIRACGEIVAAQAKIDALYKVRDTAEAEELTEPALSALYAMQHERLDLCQDAPSAAGCSRRRQA